MNDYDKLRELAQNADDENSLEWFKSGDLMIRRFEYADAEFIAAANPAVVLNLLEDLRITRSERDAEKKKRAQEAKDHTAEVLKWDEHANRLRNIIKEIK